VRSCSAATAVSSSSGPSRHENGRPRGASRLQCRDERVRPPRDHLRLSLAASVGVAEQPVRAGAGIRAKPVADVAAQPGWDAEPGRQRRQPAGWPRGRVLRGPADAERPSSAGEDHRTDLVVSADGVEDVTQRRLERPLSPLPRSGRFSTPVRPVQRNHGHWTPIRQGKSAATAFAIHHQTLARLSERSVSKVASPIGDFVVMEVVTRRLQEILVARSEICCCVSVREEELGG
jgi:hypothetical protein